MPSERHNRLAEAGLVWLRNKLTGRGLRGGFEVPVADGYVADAVGLGTFQWRYAATYIGEDKLPQEIEGVLVPEVACIFEAKATRSDFLATFGNGDRHENRKYPIGDLHWAVCTRKIAEPGELPDFWGLLVTRGGGLQELKPPIYYPVSQSTLDHIAYQVLWYAKNSHEPFARGVYDTLEH